MRRYRKDGEPMSPEDFEKGIKGLEEQEDVTEVTEPAEDEDDLTPEERIQMVRDRRDCNKDAEDPEDLEAAKKQIEEQGKDIDILLDSIDELQAQKDIETTDGALTITGTANSVYGSIWLYVYGYVTVS